jgi:hypothetical protein
MTFVLIMTFWGATVQDGAAFGGPATIVANFTTEDRCKAAEQEMTKELEAKHYAAVTGTCLAK